MTNRYVRDQASVYLRVPTSQIRKVRVDERRAEAVVIYGPSFIKRRIALSEIEKISRRPRQSKEPAADDGSAKNESPGTSDQAPFEVPDAESIAGMTREELVDEFTKDQLLEIAEAHEVEVPARANKAAIAEALRPDETSETGEQSPEE